MNQSMGLHELIYNFLTLLAYKKSLINSKPVNFFIVIALQITYKGIRCLLMANQLRLKIYGIAGLQ